MCQTSGFNGGPVPFAVFYLTEAKSAQDTSQKTEDAIGYVGIDFKYIFILSPFSCYVGARRRANVTVLKIEIVKK